MTTQKKTQKNKKPRLLGHVNCISIFEKKWAKGIKKQFTEIYTQPVNEPTKIKSPSFTFNDVKVNSGDKI